MYPFEAEPSYRNQEPRGIRSSGSSSNGISVIPPGNPITIVTPPLSNHRIFLPSEYLRYPTNTARVYGLFESWDRESEITEVPTNGSRLKEDAITQL